MISTNNLGNSLLFHICFLSEPTGYSRPGAYSQGKESFTRALSCYTETTHSSHASKTRANIPGTTCLPAPHSEGEDPTPGEGEVRTTQGRASHTDGRGGSTLWWSVGPWGMWGLTCPVGEGSAITAGGCNSNHRRARVLQREGRRGGLLTAPAGAVLARANRHSSGKSHAWTQDPPILADVISKRSHAQTSLWYLNSNYCFPQN